LAVKCRRHVHAAADFRKIQASRERLKTIEDIREARGKTLLARMASPEQKAQIDASACFDVAAVTAGSAIAWYEPPGQKDRPMAKQGGVQERIAFTGVPTFLKKMSGCVMYPWPIGNFDYVMDDALNIAMDYLDRTGHATPFKQAQSTAARAIIVAWQSGVQHRIKLANVAIRAVEQNEPAQRG
jgi:hypothetical protein